MNFIPLKDLFLKNTFDNVNFPPQAYLTLHLFKILSLDRDIVGCMPFSEHSVV